MRKRENLDVIEVSGIIGKWVINDILRRKEINGFQDINKWAE